jgi:SAM-dependent methyltransferase
MSQYTVARTTAALGEDSMAHEHDTWHYGLIARWWAEFNRGGDDVEFFRQAIERCGEPGLDLGCGTGRLLVPFLEAGLDVDGCDVSKDMLAYCAEYAERQSVRATLEAQRICELDLDRKYNTIIICGSFGLAGSRADDLEGLRRIHRHLEPGGSLVFDHYLPNVEKQTWGAWLSERRPKLPAPFPAQGDRRRCEDGTELELIVRLREFDPLEQTVTREMRAEHWIDGELAAREESTISINIYFKREIELMLAVAGFSDVRMTGNHTAEPARAYDHGLIVFEAKA